MLLRRLAEREPGELPLLSVYLDRRRPGDATDPAVREARTVLRGRLDEISEAVPKHGPARDSFAADHDRIEALLSGIAQQHERGVAVFACDGEGLFETLLSWSPFEVRIEAGSSAFLLPLARLADHDPALVALADTNSLRLFVSQPERLEELPSIDDDPDDYSRVRVGPSSQAEHHVDEHRRDFARRAADLVAATAAREEAERLVLAGVDAAVTALRERLPKAVAERVRETVHVAPNTHGEIEAGVLPAIAKLEADDARDSADRLLGMVASDGAGAAGIESTARALEAGQGLELLVDEGGPASEAAIERLVHLAARVGTPITFVRDHTALQEAGGVGALLRYRP
jgi:hypothetical protein